MSDIGDEILDDMKQQYDRRCSGLVEAAINLMIVFHVPEHEAQSMKRIFKGIFDAGYVSGLGMSVKQMEEV